MTRAEDKPRMAAIGDPVLGITSEKLQKLQEEDESLLRVRELGGGGGGMDESEEGYFWKDDRCIYVFCIFGLSGACAC